MPRLLSLSAGFLVLAATALSTDVHQAGDVKARANNNIPLVKVPGIPALDTSKLYWNLVQTDGSAYSWPPNVPNTDPGPGDISIDDYAAFGFASMEMFQTLLSVAAPLQQSSSAIQPRAMAWAASPAYLYGGMYLTSALGSKTPTPIGAGTQAALMTLPQLVQWVVTTKQWNAGFATLVSKDPGDKTKYGYASFKIANIDDADLQRGVQDVSLPAVPSLAKMAAGITPLDFIRVNMTAPVDFDCHQSDNLA